MRRPLMLAACLALALGGPARAAEAPPCLTPQQFADLTAYALPSVIAGLAQRCAASLPASAYLRNNGAALAARYAAIKPATWPGAKAAFLRMTAGVGGDMATTLGAMPDAAQQQLVDTLVAGAVSQRVDLGRCAPISEALRLLSPLPPESTAQIIGIAIGLNSAVGAAHFGKLSICAANQP